MKTDWFSIDGDVDVQQYPPGFFHHALRMDFSTAIRSENVLEQYFSVVPRHWFIDAWFRCKQCNEEFCWAAQEQKHWFDELKFYVGVVPNRCKTCRQSIRQRKELRKQYDAEITAALRKSATSEMKKKMLGIIDLLKQSFGNNIPDSIQKNQQTLEKQLLKQNN
jgi:hypothetical protein